METIIKRDERNLRNLPNFMVTLVGVDSLICFVSIIGLIVSLLIKKDFILWIVLFGISIIFSIFCEKFFNWYIGVEYLLNKKRIEYSYRLNGYSSSDKRVVVSIGNCNRYKVSGNGKKITVYGNVTKKAPLRKPQILEKITLEFNLKEDEKQKIIEYLDSMKG